MEIAFKDLPAQINAEILDKGDTLPDGVYFGLPDDIYHAQPRLSASGVTNLLLSPIEFWANSWMNPMKDKYDTDTEAKKEGTAYHKLVLEGVEAWEQKYCAPFYKDPEIDWIETVADLSEKLKEYGVSTTGTKPVLIDRLTKMEPSIAWRILDLQKERYLEENGVGKIVLNDKKYAQMKIADAMLKRDPACVPHLAGGYAEVSILYTVNGIRMKIRPDKMLVDRITDFKTIANQRGKKIDVACYHAIAEYKYFVKARFYMDGLPYAVGLINEGLVHGDVDPQFLADFCATEEHRYFFIFQQKGIAPISRAYEFPRTVDYQDRDTGEARHGASMIFGAAAAMIENAVERYLAYQESFGTDIWLDTEPCKVLDDGRYPAWATNDIV